MPEQPTTTSTAAPTTRRRLTGVGIALLAGFFGLGLLARNGTDADTALSDRLHGLWRAPVGDVASIVSAVLGPALPALLGLSLIVSAVRRHRTDPQRAGLLLRVLVVLAVCRLVSAVAKPLFARDRPREFPDWAYPSGHVTSVAATGFAAWLLAAWLAPHLRRTVAVAAVLATVTCAACRVVLDVHWLTDTVGAVAGVTGAGLVTVAALRLTPVPPRPPGVESAP